MTTLTIPAAELRRALQSVKPAITRSSYLPVLKSVKFDEGRIVTTNLDITISAPLVGTGSATGQLAPHAALLKALPTKKAELRGDAILTWTDDTVTLECAGRSVTLPVAPVKDFPRLPVVSEPDTLLDLVALRSVAGAMSNETSRPILCSVYVNGSSIVATDSYRLYLVDSATMSLEGPGVLLTSELVNAVLTHKGIVKASIRVAQHDATVTADDGTTFTGRLVEGTFPNYRELIPANQPHSVTFGRDEMAETVKTAGSLANCSTTPVRLKAEGEKVTASLCQEGMTSFECTIRGESDEAVEIAFNPAYFLGALAGAPEQVTLHTDSLKPAVICWSDDEGRGHKRLLMPVRVA